MKLRIYNGNKIKASEVTEKFGILDIMPEWVTLTDINVELDPIYRGFIEKDTENEKIVNPLSFKIGKYGEVADFEGNMHVLEGIIYQYSYKYNPRNVKYAYKLFLNFQIVSENGNLRSTYEAESLCNLVARKMLNKF
jgi:hypothetical protein